MAKKPQDNEISSDFESLFSSRFINLNDVHYCNLEAIVEAQSGREAVENYIRDQHLQILKDHSKPDRNDFDDDGSGLGDVEIEKILKRDTPYEQVPEGLKITELDMISNMGLMRYNMYNFSEIQLSRFKISTADKPDAYVWVYKMGEHWVICT